MSKQPDVYEVEINGAYRALVQTTSIPKARSRALQFVKVRKLSGSEVIAAMNQGLAIDVDDSKADGADYGEDGKGDNE